jgi:hypothetical protein
MSLGICDNVFLLLFFLLLAFRVARVADMEPLLI